jgi:CubicO group peptidase (beta-lactamase class C family)
MTCLLPLGIFGTAFAVLSLAGLGSAAQAPWVYPGLKANEFMTNWLVLSPLPVSADKSPDEAAQKKAFSDDLLAGVGGEAAIQPQPGLKLQLAGKDYQWRLLQAKGDTVDLKEGQAAADFMIAYAWAEVEMPKPATVLFGLGSDDAVKVWLNGKVAHENWIARATQPDDDLVELKFQPGKNRLLLKVQNMQGDWSFTCRQLANDELQKKMTTAAARGDLDTLGKLLGRGLNVNARSRSGLTPLQAARLHGQKEAADFLLGKGADPKAQMPPFDKVADAFFGELIKSNWPGAAVLVAKDGKVLFKRGYGLACLEHRVPVTPQTKFRIGSITKQFTAAAILKLQEEGKLSLQDKLAKYVPDFPRGEEVTIHHLLTHTSGIHSYTSKPDFMDAVRAPVKAEDLIKSFKNDPYDFDPGKKWAYNNSGFFLLGYIIEKVSGQSYGEFLREKFFAPLGMKDTGVHNATDIYPHEAYGYAYEGGQPKKALNWDMSRAGGAGALYSTVEDLYRWNEAVFNGKVLSPESLKAAFTPALTAQDEQKPKEEGYGYGWAIAKLRGCQEIEHGGGLQGFVSYLLRLPKEHFTVVVLANSAPPVPGVDAGGLAHELAQLYLGDKMEVRVRPAVSKNVSPQTLEAYVGRYDYGGAVLTVTRDGDRLFAQLTGQSKHEIFPSSETNFFWKVVEAEVTFVKDDKGKVTKAIHRQSGQTLHAPKLEDVQEVKLSPAALDAVVGKYDYGQGKSILTVTREGERLFAQLTGQPRVEIFAKSETEFFWKVVNARVTFVKDDKGKVIKAIHEQGLAKFEAPKLE